MVIKSNSNSLGVNTTTVPIFYGDSLTYGFGATSPALSWAGQLCMNRMWAGSNRGVGGQPVTTGLAGSFDPSVIPNKSSSNNKIFFAWGTNDCWKAPSVAAFNTSYTAVINNAKGKGWTGNIVLVTGYYCVNNAFFTQAQYLTYVAETVTIAASTSVQVIDLFTYMQNNGGSALLTVDNVHLNDLGYTVAKNYINTNI